METKREIFVCFFKKNFVIKNMCLIKLCHIKVLLDIDFAGTFINYNSKWYKYK